jgi:hypothetical protein
MPSHIWLLAKRIIEKTQISIYEKAASRTAASVGSTWGISLWRVDYTPGNAPDLLGDHRISRTFLGVLGVAGHWKHSHL